MADLITHFTRGTDARPHVSKVREHGAPVPTHSPDRKPLIQDRVSRTTHRGAPVIAPSIPVSPAHIPGRGGNRAYLVDVCLYLAATAESRDDSADTVDPATLDGRTVCLTLQVWALSGKAAVDRVLLEVDPGGKRGASAYLAGEELSGDTSARVASARDASYRE